MKKKITLFLAAIMVVIIAVTGCGGKTGNDTSSKKSNTEKAKADTFTVGFDAEFEPYGYKDDDGEYTGFDLELAQEVCDRNGWELVKQPIDWDSKDMELESGTIDCIWNGFTMTGREEDYTWTEPYVNNSQVIVTAKDSGIESLKDLSGKVVLVQADSSALAALEEDQKDLADTFAELTEVPDYNTALMNLEAGAADAVAVDYPVAVGHVKDTNGKFVILEEPISEEQYAVGFKKGNEKLRDQVQSTLDEMAKDGTIDKIATKYDDYGIPDALCIGK